MPAGWFPRRRTGRFPWALRVHHHALAEELEAGAPEHLALEHRDRVDMAIDRARATGAG